MTDPVRGSLARIAAIASLSARETLRSRSMLIAVILNLGYLALLALVGVTLWNSGLDEVLGSVDVPGERELIVRAILGFAIGGASTLGLFVGVFASVGAIANEIERGTILAVVARPVSRTEIVLGKFLGNGALAVTYLASQALVIGLIVALISGIWTNDLLVAIALLSLNVLIMVAVSLAGSTRLTTVANAIVVIVFYLAITNSGILYAIGSLTGEQILETVAELSQFSLPVGQVSELASATLSGPLSQLAREALEGRQFAPPAPGWIWIYALGYLGAVLGLGTWSLWRRDLR